MKSLFNVFPCIFVGLGLNKLLDFSKFIHPKVCILQCFGMNKLLGQILAVRREIGTKSLSLSVFFVADFCCILATPPHVIRNEAIGNEGLGAERPKFFLSLRNEGLDRVDATNS